VQPPSQQVRVATPEQALDPLLQWAQPKLINCSQASRGVALSALIRPGLKANFPRDGPRRRTGSRF